MHTIHRHIRLAICVTVTAGAMLALPAAASAAKHSHLLKIYRAEEHLTLGGADETYEVKCKTGDIAIQGMWRVDNVDQDDDLSFVETYTHEDTAPAHPNTSEWLTAVDIVTSRNKSSTGFYSGGFGGGAGDGFHNTWEYRFHKNSAGDVQLKLNVVCLAQKTAENSHQHRWRLSLRHDGAPVSSGASTWTPATGASGNGCVIPGRDTILVAPGFDQTHPGDPEFEGPYGHIFHNFWEEGPFSYKHWEWGFVTRASAPPVSTYYHCLHVTTEKVSGHTHKLRKRVRRSSPTLPAAGPGGPTFREERLECGSHYKGILGGFKIDPGHAHDHWVWYFGEDPRPKIRAWKFLNTTGTPRQVHLGLVCVHDRTT
jgi:hypothetical protein